MAKASPNQGGSNNRQGPTVRPGGERGPISGKMTSVSGSQRPFRGDKGSPSGAGRNASGSNWKKPRPSSHSSGDGGWYLSGRKRSR